MIVASLRVKKKGDRLKQHQKTSYFMSNPSSLYLPILFPPPNTTGTKNFRAPTVLDNSAETQSATSGEGVVVPEHVEYSSELQDGISRLKKRAEAEIADHGIRQKVLNSLKQADDAMMKVVKKGLLKKGKKVDKSNVNVENTMLGKRARRSKQVKFDVANGKQKAKKKIRDTERFNAGDTITAESILFDGEVAGSYPPP